MNAVDILQAEIARRRTEAERIITYCNAADQLLAIGEFSALNMLGYSWPETASRWEPGRALNTLAHNAEKEAKDAAAEAVAVAAADGEAF